MTEEAATVWAQGGVTCTACGHHWQAVVEEAEGVPTIGGLECSTCGEMRGRWDTPRHLWPKTVEP